MDTTAVTAATLPSIPAASHASDDAELTRLDPNYVTALRLTAVVSAIPCVIGALVLESILANAVPGGWPVPFGVIVGVVTFIAAAFVIRLPTRRWQARGYNMSADRLRVVRGLLWRSDTVVPFGRVQHIDLNQGPIERFFDIATLTLHTAGSHNASVHLPGLNHTIATDMREEIRQHIKRETV